MFANLENSANVPRDLTMARSNVADRPWGLDPELESNLYNIF